ncbi:hypothetical protein [Methanoculleus frigidifontis]|uniref:hypothetical protein n=1 Tax=Methanoculleus frigidifontis TaxID=2584085 RepID=UPI00265870CB|nr:hypothetical protein [Methanoculleus sp. FWC-SCC1]
MGSSPFSPVFTALTFSCFRISTLSGIYTLGDIAFVPLEVLLVTIVIHQMLDIRDRRKRLEMLNMIIGTFFSAVGTQLLTYRSDNDPHIANLREHLIVASDWTDETFRKVGRELRDHAYAVAIDRVDLSGLKEFLDSREEVLLRMLENPTLLEHESFNELLRAASHLAEDLQRRPDVASLPATDLGHLGGDINRVYRLLVHQWLDYMQYLQKNYPYLFSLALRTNPFDETASAIVG